MARVAFASPRSFLGGVSQQPEPLRQPNQAKAQDNGWISPVDGLRPRHSLDHLTRLGLLNLTAAWTVNDHGGPAQVHAIDRGENHRYIGAIYHKEPRFFDAVSGETVPVVAFQCATITLTGIPDDDARVIIDPLDGAAVTNTYRFDATPPGDAPPVYDINTAGLTINQTAALLAKRIREQSGAWVKVWANGATVFVLERTLGDNANLATEANDTGNEINIECAALDKFQYLRALKPQAITLVGSETLSPNDNTTQRDPAAVFAGEVWKQFGTVPTQSYSAHAGAPGPVGGFARGQTVSATRGAADQEAYWYYRNPNSSVSETFNSSGKWQRFSAIVRANSILNPTDEVQIGFLNSSTTTHHRAKWTFDGFGFVTSTTPTITGLGVGGIRDLGQGFYKIWFAHKTLNSVEAGNQRRPYIYISMPLAGAATKAIRITGAIFEQGGQELASGEPPDFWMNPIDAYRLMTVADQTFFVNTTVITAQDSSRKTAAQVGDEAYIWIKQALLASTYFVRIYYFDASGPTTTKIKAASHTYMAGGIAAGYGSLAQSVCAGFHGWPAGTGIQTETDCQGGTGDVGTTNADKGIWFPTTIADANEVLCKPDTEVIAQDLAFRATATAAKEYTDGINTRWVAANGSNTTEVAGTVIRLFTPKAISKLETADAFGGDAMGKMHKVVESKLDLTPNAQDGLIVKVKGDPDDDLDDSYYKFVADTPGTFGKGTWIPTIAYDTTLGFDASTMPWTFTRAIVQNATEATATGTAIGQPYFLFQPIDWTDKAAGDDTLNPPLSFIGKPIQDIFFFKNRLGFAAGQGVALSEAGRYFNFWRTDVAQVLDDDPFEVNVNDKRVGTIYHAVPHQDRLVLFSAQQQFALSSNGPFAARTVQIEPGEVFENEIGCQPVSAERSIFFGHPRGDFAGVHELFPSEEAETVKSNDVTVQVPSYLRGRLRQLAICTLEDVLIASTDTDRRFIYVFKWVENGPERLMSAWHRWDLGSPSKCLGAAFIQNNLFLLIEGSKDTTFQRMKIQSQATDIGTNWHARMDRRVNENTPGFSKAAGGGGTTVITLPYQVDSGVIPIVVNRQTGQQYVVSGQGSSGSPPVSTVTVTTDVTTTDVWVGQPFTMRYEFSKPIIRAETGALGVGRMQIDDGYLAFHTAADGSFRLLVTPLNGTEAFAGSFDASKGDYFERLPGTAPNLTLYAGRKQFPTINQADSAKIVLESVGSLGCAFSKAEFEGELTEYAQILGINKL